MSAPTLPSDRRHARCWLGAAVVATLAGCGADDFDAVYQPAPMPPHARTDATLTLDGGGARILAYRDRPATLSALHRGDAAETGCFAELQAAVALSDGSCAMTLRFGPRDDGPGLRLTAAELVARDAGVPDCAAFADVLPKDAPSVRLALQSGEAWLPLPAPEPGATGPLALDQLYVWPRGTVKLAAQTAAGEVAATLDLSTTRFGGDVQSQLADAGACTPCPNGGACQSPYPGFRLRDFQTESVGLNLRTPMDVFLGVPVALILTQGW